MLLMMIRRFGEALPCGTMIASWTHRGVRAWWGIFGAGELRRRRKRLRGALGVNAPARQRRRLAHVAISAASPKFNLAAEYQRAINSGGRPIWLRDRWLNVRHDARQVQSMSPRRTPRSTRESCRNSLACINNEHAKPTANHRWLMIVARPALTGIDAADDPSARMQISAPIMRRGRID